MESKKPFHEVVAERLIEQLKQGTAPWQMPWKAGDGGGMMPFNPTTGKRYKGINAIHLLSQGREDQRWLTFNQAKAEGGQVRKGEKSTAIQYWKFEEKQVKRDENNNPVLDASGDPVKVLVRLERPKMFMANVFNAEQIDGLPLYERPIQSWSAVARAEAILEASGADIRHGGDRAYYRPSTDNIQMPGKEQFPSAENYYATVLHELGHWTGHGTRLDRDLSHPFGSEGYAKEELRAEIASMILGDELGIGHSPDQHVAYVESWIKALQNDPMEIFRASSDAEKIQSFVLGLEQQQIQTQDQAQRQQPSGSEQMASMQVLHSKRPSAQAEEWTLNAIEHTDELAQTIRRMTDKQLVVFADVLESMHPLNSQNEFWVGRENAMNKALQDVDSAVFKINFASESVSDEQHRRIDVANRMEGMASKEPENVLQPLPVINANEKMVATALRNMRSEPDVELKESFGRLLEVTSSQSLGYVLPGDWTGETQVTGIVTDPDGESVSMVQGDQTPEFYGLYAWSQKGLSVWLADYATEQEANSHADRLAAINSNAYVEKVVKNEPPLIFAQEKTQETQSHDTDRTYIHVPFKEKEQARELGAKWDRQESSWYIPSGVNKEVFSHWLNPVTDVQDMEQVQQKPKISQGVSREYLAVPFGERAAAKAAGAVWDVAAKSWYAGPDGDVAALARWKPESVSNEQLPALSVRDEFKAAMDAVGLIHGGKLDHPIMDGKKHRVPVIGGRKGAVDGFYVAHLDGHPAGVLINNKTGVDMKWKSKGYSLNAEQKAVLHAEAASKLQAREDALLLVHENISKKVTRSMDNLVPVVELTPYMRDKGIEPFIGVLTDKSGKETIIPAIDENGKQWTAQYIQKDGTKRFAKDGRKEGCFHAVGGLDAVGSVPVIVIAEGYATASTLASTLGHATVAAFDSGNLMAVAKALKGKFPDKPIVIAGDDDRHQVMSHGTNTGKTKAIEAAKAVGGKAVFPTFAPGEALYPEGLQPITPLTYRRHVKAKAEIKEMLNEGGASAIDPNQSPRAAMLRAEFLSDSQVEALEKMKRLTDFNDLATKSTLGRQGLERQIKSAISKVVDEHEINNRQPKKERIQDAGRGVDDKKKTRRMPSH
ncbi:zincin-like metallopeptidase domain-containing protein [Pseudomonas helleri]|uniref:zincin-like metallopeptidase domain-containing protein n=1 Tax=Pseudomonas helleri TaxID=1608996 RepID=UPI003FD1D80F